MITSITNKQIKNVISLQKKSKERRKQNVFVVEGIRLVVEAPIQNIKALYVSEEIVGSDAFEDNLIIKDFMSRCEENLVSVEIVSKNVFKAMSDTVSPQGVLAIVERCDYKLDVNNSSFLMLEDIQDPGNLGTLFRTAEAAGIDAVIMSDGCVDLYNPKTIRSTMGTIYRMPHIKCSKAEWQDIMNTLCDNGFNIYGASLGALSSYYEVDMREKCAFVIGNEGNGITKDTLKRTIPLIIPMEGKIESLNAAMAGGILMYEMNRQRRMK